MEFPQRVYFFSAQALKTPILCGENNHKEHEQMEFKQRIFYSSVLQIEAQIIAISFYVLIAISKKKFKRKYSLNYAANSGIHNDWDFWQ